MNNRHLNKTLLFLLKLLVSAALLWFIFKRIDVVVLMESIKGARVSRLLVCAFVLVGGGFAGAASWYNVIRAGSLNVRYMRVASMHWCGMFFNSFLPSNVGGDFFKGWMLVTDQCKGVSLVAASIIVDRLLNFSLLVITGLAAFALSCGKIFPVVVLLGSAFAAFVTLAFAAHYWRPKEQNSRFVIFVQSLLNLFRSPRRCAFSFCAAALSQGCKIGCHFFILTALGLEIDPAAIWYVIPVFGVVSALPISFNGLGIRESAALLIAQNAGVTGEDLVALSLFSHIMFVAVNSLGIFPFLMHRRTAA